MGKGRESREWGAVGEGARENAATVHPHRAGRNQENECLLAITPHLLGRPIIRAHGSLCCPLRDVDVVHT